LKAKNHAAQKQSTKDIFLGVLDAPINWIIIAKKEIKKKPN